VLGSFAGEAVVALLLPVTAGGFVYIAAADLIPELQEDRSLRALAAQTALMSMGIGLMALLAILE
jgi:zinc and cadmium transporter